MKSKTEILEMTGNERDCAIEELIDIIEIEKDRVEEELKEKTFKIEDINDFIKQELIKGYLNNFFKLVEDNVKVVYEIEGFNSAIIKSKYANVKIEFMINSGSIKITSIDFNYYLDYLEETEPLEFVPMEEILKMNNASMEIEVQKIKNEIKEEIEYFTMKWRSGKVEVANDFKHIEQDFLDDLNDLLWLSEFKPKEGKDWNWDYQYKYDKEKLSTKGTIIVKTENSSVKLEFEIPGHVQIEDRISLMHLLDIEIVYNPNLIL